ncbi:TatD family hydrolase [Thioalkalivibrio thiocyanodenitrificans]|uniref:TatD family hydrolase n=1 Tax=Thioalkalivibrio thiocyanodenitrificans TaxID=243063 RepID=UPI0018DDBA3C|nr:TatD family hydrolase [Thioalkalivibrio thiocyanodenitrificans]
MLLTDTHCHFDDPAFDGDRDDCLGRARSAGVGALVLPAVSRSGWPRLKAVAASHEGLHPAYGLHPVLLAEHAPADLDELARWIERERPVAVGECGLDYFVAGLDPDTQWGYFTAQLALAREHDIPAIIHARRSVDQVTRGLRQCPGVRAVVHSFSGSEQQARKLIDLGCLLGFGGPVTYPRARRLRTLAATLPLEAILLETDAPDQPGAMHRGRRNEPAFLPEIAAEIAALRGMAPDELAEATTENARQLFGLS